MKADNCTKTSGTPCIGLPTFMSIVKKILKMSYSYVKIRFCFCRKFLFCLLKGVSLIRHILRNEDRDEELTVFLFLLPRITIYLIAKGKPFLYI